MHEVCRRRYTIGRRATKGYRVPKLCSRRSRDHEYVAGVARERIAA